jgi:hypothetical protein
MDCKHEWIDVRTIANPNQYVCGLCGKTSDGRGESNPSGPTLAELADRQTAEVLAAFASGLKAHLRASDRQVWAYTEGYDTSGYYTVVDWDELDAAIDAFAAEFQKVNG